jgi:hypothetical protein
MKVALVCIAKNEDNYIQEWIDYNKKLGFDDIFIYQNDWRCSIDEPNVTKLVLDGINRQRGAYNHFIKTYGSKYDWIAFFDIDEFLVLKKHNNVQEFVSDYVDYPAIGINWVLFGDNGLKSVDSEYSVIKRFTKRENKTNNHIKSIVKYSDTLVMDVHHPNCFWVDTNKNMKIGAFNQSPLNDVAQINHYFCKTKEEFIKKCERGRADTDTIVRPISDFDRHNFNHQEDLTAYNFLYDNNNILNT